jgi:predicted ATPase
LRDLGVHRLQDLADPEHVFALTHADVPDDFPALRSLDALPNNLPAELTSFVGREDDIAQLVKAVKTTRLVTLTGAAGCGKTRLALQVAAEVLPDFAHGVWLVELAALTDAGLVPQEIATVVGVREQSGTSIADAVVDYLRSRHALLVIDNCEHLLAACAGLVTTLLRSCPELSIIATSREALAIAGETSWRCRLSPSPTQGTFPSRH